MNTQTPPVPPLPRTPLPGGWIIRHPHGTWGECYLTMTAQKQEDALALFRRAARRMDEEGGRIVNAHVFGNCAMAPEACAILHTNRPPFPITWVDDATGLPPFGGVFLHAVTGDMEIQDLECEGRSIGTVYGPPDARVALLGDLRPTRTHLSPGEQTAGVLADIDTALAAADMDFSHVVRTRFYLDRILDWYDEFNRVRTGFFKQHRVFDNLVPASTGIGAANPTGTAILAALIAVKGPGEKVESAAVDSPLQGAATAYGSSFSRAVECRLPDHRRLMISGTASIDLSGATTHVGDIHGQIQTTFDVVGALLESRGMQWDDVVRGIAYFRHPHEVTALEDFLCRGDVPRIPLILSHSVVCRDDLLFELEVDAIRADR